MNSVPLLMLLGVVPIFLRAQTQIAPADANKHVGETVKICGKVQSGMFLTTSNNSQTFLRLGEEYPSPPLTVIFWQEVRQALHYKPEEHLPNKAVCVIGKIELLGTKPRIVLTESKNLQLMDLTVAIKRNPEEDYDKVFTKVEYEPEFPGGGKAWEKYLAQNLDSLAPLKDNARPGTYIVKVEFIVSKSGALSNVRAINPSVACPSCAVAAVEVIKRGPSWLPATPDGINVI